MTRKGPRPCPSCSVEEIRAALRGELGRDRLRPRIWADLVTSRHVQLVAEGRATVERLAAAYLLKEEIYFPEPKARRRRELPTDRRAQALAQIVAHRLDTLVPQAAAFRDRHLNGQFLPLKEMTDWIKAQAASEVLPPEAPYAMRRTLAFLSPTRRLVELEIRSDGVLAELKEIATTLVKTYHTGWDEAEAVVFILTKAIPPIPLGRSAVKFGVVPSASHITLVVSPRLAPREVAAFYSEIRGGIGLGRDKPFAVKHLALAVFVERTMSSGRRLG